MGQRDPRTHVIIGAGIEAHRELGQGFLEKVYQEALAVELQARGVPFRREVELPTFYKGVRLAADYRADFICYDGIIVEVKAIRKLSEVEAAQVINYLKVTRQPLGLLLNFGTESLEYKRFVQTTSAQSA